MRGLLVTLLAGLLWVALAMGHFCAAEASLERCEVTGLFASDAHDIHEGSTLLAPAPRHNRSVPSAPYHQDAARGGCLPGDHAPVLRTVMLTASAANLRQVPGQPVEFVDLYINHEHLAQLTPFVLNDAGALSHGVLSTPQLVADWAALSAAAALRPGHLFPALGAACSLQGAAPRSVAALLAGGAAPFSEAPVNALLAHGNGKAVVVDIYSVFSADGAAVLRLRWRPDPHLVPEASGCHARQRVEDAHYHHLLAGGLTLASSLAELRGSGAGARPLTLFVKGDTPSCSPGYGIDGGKHMGRNSALPPPVPPLAPQAWWPCASPALPPLVRPQARASSAWRASFRRAAPTCVRPAPATPFPRRRAPPPATPAPCPRRRRPRHRPPLLTAAATCSTPMRARGGTC